MKKILLLILSIAIFLYLQNNWLQVTNIKITSDEINDDITIVQLSDLHTKLFGTHNSRLIKKIKEISPEIIAITGDIVDVEAVDLIYIEELAQQLVDISSVFYVTGNHEGWSFKSNEIKKILVKSDVNVLTGNTYTFHKNNSVINICGIDDPEVCRTDIDQVLHKLSLKEGYKLFLSHRPEYFKSTYSNYNIDLILSGHAHGGQFILPFIGGLIAPDQGLLPEYYSGLYTIKNTNMIVSRGLGNSIISIRLFNRPEIVVVKLMKE